MMGDTGDGRYFEEHNSNFFSDFHIHYSEQLKTIPKRNHSHERVVSKISKNRLGYLIILLRAIQKKKILIGKSFKKKRIK